MATEAMEQGWSSLPADLVNRVADCILATNDLDYYMDLRGVCHHWRSATADPKTSSHDARFRPTRWIVLDDAAPVAPAARSRTFLFVNASTGRFLRKCLPNFSHNNYQMHFVTTTTGGLVILADGHSPYAARVLNPFTGSLIRFTAPVPCRRRVAAGVVGSSPTLVLACNSSSRLYWADPESPRFSVDSSYASPGSMLALAGGRCATGLAHGPVEVHTDAELPARQYIDLAMIIQRGTFVLEVDGHKTMVIYDGLGIDVFSMDSAGGVIGLVKSIGNHALFLGERCLCVDAGKFPSVEANCIYLVGQGWFSDTVTYNLSTRKVGRISGAANSYPIYSGLSDDVPRPLTIVQLLNSYTMDIPNSELYLESESELNACDASVYYELFSDD